MAQAQAWNVQYIETSAKTRENVDKAFSEIFVKIKELKAQRRLNNNAGGGGFNSARANSANNLTKEEEEAIRADSLKKRVKKFYQKFKKKCILSWILTHPNII